MLEKTGEIEERNAEYQINNAEELRQVLREAELSVANLRGFGPKHALSFLHMLDVVEEAIPRLEASYQVDLKPERTRLQTLENITRSKAGVLVAETGRLLAREREKVAAAEEHWWWYLDEYEAQKRKSTLRRWGIRGAVVIAVLVVFSLVYRVFFAPSPGQVALSNYLSQGESLLLSGDLEAAAAEYEAAKAADPTDQSAYFYLAAIYEVLGEEEKSAEAYQKAQEMTASQADFHANLSLVYYRMSAGGLDAIAQAEREAIAAVEADENSAMAHFALASVYELQNKVAEAIEEFDLASSLSDDPSLTVLARMRMGMLMQRPGDTGQWMPGLGLGF